MYHRYVVGFYLLTVVDEAFANCPPAQHKAGELPSELSEDGESACMSFIVKPSSAVILSAYAGQSGYYVEGDGGEDDCVATVRAPMHGKEECLKAGDCFAAYRGEACKDMPELSICEEKEADIATVRVPATYNDDKRRRKRQTTRDGKVTYKTMACSTSGSSGEDRETDSNSGSGPNAMAAVFATLGAVIFIILATVGGIFLYRRHKERHLILVQTVPDAFGSATDTTGSHLYAEIQPRGRGTEVAEENNVTPPMESSDTGRGKNPAPSHYGTVDNVLYAGNVDL